MVNLEGNAGAKAEAKAAVVMGKWLEAGKGVRKWSGRSQAGMRARVCQRG